MDLLEITNSLGMNVLHRAVKENRLEAVKHLVANGADVSYAINKKETPLYIATMLNYHSIMEELIKYKTRKQVRELINAKCPETGTTALHVAAKNNSIESVRILLKNGANIGIVDDSSTYAFILTTDNSINRLFSSIYDIVGRTIAGDNKGLINQLDSCSSSEDLPAVMYARDSQGYTALQLAIENCQLDALASIVSYRIKNFYCSWKAGFKNLDKLIKYSNAVRRQSSTLDDALCRFVKIKRTCYDNSYVPYDERITIIVLLNNVFELLNTYGNIKLTDHQCLLIIDESFEMFGNHLNERINKLLMQRDFISAVKLLKLSIVAPMLLFMKSVYSSELREAAKQNNLSLVEKCLTGYPELNEVDDDKGWTALHYALRHGNIRMIKILLNFGADPTWSSENNKITPLHALLPLPVSNEDNLRVKIVEAIKLHLDCIKDEKLASYIDAKDPNGSTALHLAARHNEKWFVELLLSRGATYCIKDADGKSPEDLADPNIKALFRYIDELFAHALNGNTDELMSESLKISHGNTLLAVCGARNNQGLTLLQVLDREGRVIVADEIKKMMADTVWHDE